MSTVADTAFAMCVVRAAEGERPAAERLFEDPYASLFHAGGAEAREGTQRFLDLPFFTDGMRLRTRFIDDVVRDGLAAGLGQVVLLGAGFDTRGLRLAEIQAGPAPVYEVDFAEQLERKRALLGAGGVTLPASIAHVACDLAAPDFDETLTAGLEARGFRRGGGAVFVWEGVLDYLDAGTARRNLEFMARVGGPGTRVVFTFGYTRFEPETALDHVRRAGFTTCEELGFDDLWRRYLPGDPHPNAWACRVATATV
jgi:methyltransferase (TIGR00027 family)